VVGSPEELIDCLASAIISIGHQVGVRPVHGLNRVSEPDGHGHDIGPALSQAEAAVCRSHVHASLDHGTRRPEQLPPA
jgi:hypothetical protein